MPKSLESWKTTYWILYLGTWDCSVMLGGVEEKNHSRNQCKVTVVNHVFENDVPEFLAC